MLKQLFITMKTISSLQLYSQSWDERSLITKESELSMKHALNTPQQPSVDLVIHITIPWMLAFWVALKEVGVGGWFVF